MKKKILIFLFLLIVSVPSIISLFNSGFFQSDDGEWMIIRFSAFHQALRDGQFPVRFLGRLNFGYGYPVANFLYPGFMYFAEIPKILGFSFVASIKIILGLSMVTSGVFTFFWLRKFFGKFESFIGSLFYLYAPYHLFDLYRRGSVGEVLALAILPFILWQIENRNFFWSSVGIALLILSHNTLALLFLPLIFGYLLLDYFIRQLKIYWYIGILALGLGLSAFFWLPAIFELQYTLFLETKVANFPNYFSSLGLIGIPNIILLLISILLLFKVPPWSRWNLGRNLSGKQFVFFTIFGFLSVFLSLEQSSVFWKIAPSSFIQFPFRFLSVTILTASFLAACCLSVLSRKIKLAIGFILLLLLIISAKPFLTPSQFFDKGEGFYATNEGTTTVQDEYLPKWVKEKPREHFKEKVEVVTGEAEISNLFSSSKKITFDVDSVNGAKIRVNTIYFPGWKAFADGEESVIDYDNAQGVMGLLVSKGEHNIRFVFAETPLRLISDTISLVSLFFLLGLVLKRKYEIF